MKAQLSHLCLYSIKLPQENTSQEKVIDISSTHVINIPDPKDTGASSSTQIEGQFPCSKLEEIWEQCSQALKGNKPEVSKTPSQEKVLDISEMFEKTLITTRTIDQSLEVEDIEIIPPFPTLEVVLRVEEIPPLDIFYSPQHKAMVKRQRNKRNTD